VNCGGRPISDFRESVTFMALGQLSPSWDSPQLPRLLQIPSVCAMEEVRLNSICTENIVVNDAFVTTNQPGPINFARKLLLEGLDMQRLQLKTTRVARLASS